MKVLSHLIELFEKDPSFLKEWREDAISAIAKRNLPDAGAEESLRGQVGKALRGLFNRDYLKKQPKLFGM